MKVIIEDIGPGEEEQLILRCRELDASLMQLINKIKTGDLRLMAQKDGHWFRIEPGDIYYIESVDNKVFFYSRDNCYESRQKLYELETLLESHNFFRISKSLIVNLAKIRSLAPAFNGRLEAMLQNGERVMISRQYVVRLKEVLGL